MEKNIDLQEALDASIIFANALTHIFQDRQGIIVDVPQDSKMYELLKKVVVFKFNDKIHIYKCEDDMVAGTTVMLDTTTDEDKK